MTQERVGAATLGGKPITLVGPELRVGELAPNFTTNKNFMEEVSLSDFNGLVKLISVIPSLYTSICIAQTRYLNEISTKIGDNVIFLTISVDLPFSISRFCSVEYIDNIIVLSDYKNRSFGTKYGVLIKEFQLYHRTIFIIDANNIIRYVEYVPEMVAHPNYYTALKALKELV